MGIVKQETTEEKHRKLLLENTEINKKHLNGKIQEKIDRYNGLVTEEAAIYLVGRDLGIEINKELEEDQELSIDIENLQPEMYDVECEFQVDKVNDKVEGDDWVLRNVLLKDDTGKIKLNLWNKDAEKAGKIKEGETIEIKNAYTDTYKGDLQLKLSKDGSVIGPDGGEVI